MPGRRVLRGHVATPGQADDGDGLVHLGAHAVVTGECAAELLEGVAGGGNLGVGT